MNAEPDIVPVFQDEVHFQAQTSITRMWAPKGSVPKVMSKPGKNNVAYSGFVIPETGELFVMKPRWFNFETVIQSFRDFINAKPIDEWKNIASSLTMHLGTKKAIRLIWGEEQPEYQDIREAMTYLSLPPYSPDLNPIEQVWRKTRREKTHNRYFGSLPQITDVLDDYFKGFYAPNEQLRNLCGFECFQAA